MPVLARLFYGLQGTIHFLFKFFVEDFSFGGQDSFVGFSFHFFLGGLYHVPDVAAFGMAFLDGIKGLDDGYFVLRSTSDASMCSAFAVIFCHCILLRSQLFWSSSGHFGFFLKGHLLIRWIPIWTPCVSIPL